MFPHFKKKSLNTNILETSKSYCDAKKLTLKVGVNSGFIVIFHCPNGVFSINNVVFVYI